jgi:phosphoglycolate phosphatase-like HAD superfamily hydrolase
MTNEPILTGIDALVFDLDGVILESGDIKTQAFLDLFAEYPEHRAAFLAFHLANLGVSRYDKFEWFYRERLGIPLSAEVKHCLGERFSELALGKVLSCPLVPGARETLEQLCGLKLLFVASGTPQAELELILERRGLMSYFEGVWGSPLKKTEIVESILVRYALRRDAVLFVGDGSSDYEAALATGTQFIARETPEMAGLWRTLGVRRIVDLTEFSLVYA